MGKLDANRFRTTTNEEFRVLKSVEMGQKNTFEYVPEHLIEKIANLKHRGCPRILYNLSMHSLLAYNKSKDGVASFRLTRQGFNFLALRELTNSKVIKSLGNVIGVGKESEVYSVEGEEDSLLCIKFHILGEQSFRQVKKKRDFHKRNDFLSRFELSRKSAEKEFLYLEKLYKKGFPVPQPIKNNRHAVVMEYIHGEPLYKVRRKELRNPGKLYRECMDLIVQFAHLGLIHGDFNEFNLLLVRKVRKNDGEADDDDNLSQRKKIDADDVDEKITKDTNITKHTNITKDTNTTKNTNITNDTKTLVDIDDNDDDGDDRTIDDDNKDNKIDCSDSKDNKFDNSDDTNDIKEGSSNSSCGGGGNVNGDGSSICSRDASGSKQDGKMVKEKKKMMEDRGEEEKSDEDEDGDEDDDGDLFYYDDWKLYVFDLPQVVSVRHENAEEYFDRDVDCIRIFFKKRFHYECDDYPQFKDVLGKRSPDPDHVNEDDDDVEDDHDDDDAATMPLDDLKLENDDENDDCLDVES